MVDESEDGDYRKYFDEKNSFGLEVNKIKSKKPDTTIKDSLFSWSRTCNSFSGIKKIEADSVLVNNIDLMTFTFKCEKKKLTTQFYTFPAKNQVYQLKFTYPSARPEKAKKEMNKIIQSLALDCD